MGPAVGDGGQPGRRRAGRDRVDQVEADAADRVAIDIEEHHCRHAAGKRVVMAAAEPGNAAGMPRSEEHTSELQSLMRISYAVFCLKKKNNISNTSNIKKSRYPITDKKPNNIYSL